MKHINLFKRRPATRPDWRLACRAGSDRAWLPQAQPKRIISLVPNVTEILFAIGAGPQVVAVSTYDVEPPEVRSLPTVGALVDPDTERIIALRPDLVITYGSQSDLQPQLKRVSIPFFDYRHGGLDHIMATMRALGARTGHVDQAEKVARRPADAHRCGEKSASPASRGRRRCWCSAASPARCATSTRAPAADSSTTCWSPRAAKMC